MSEHADYIAISFDFSWYQQVGLSFSRVPKVAKLERMCSGRRWLIATLIRDGIWNHDKPHHLLGCSLAREFSAYSDIKSIRSVDTSNPVVAGILNQRYIANYGLQDKPSILLADLIDHNVTPEQAIDIIFNTTEFKNIIKQ
jgi:hypothetical protein